jgi:hypothetical protein
MTLSGTGETQSGACVVEPGDLDLLTAFDAGFHWADAMFISNRR